MLNIHLRDNLLALGIYPVGTAGQVLTVAGGVPTWGGAVSSVSSALIAAVLLSAAGYIDVLSVSLAPGTWIAVAQMYVENPSAGTISVWKRIYDSTGAATLSEVFHNQAGSSSGTGAWSVQVMTPPFVLSATSTIKLQAAVNGTITPNPSVGAAVPSGGGVPGSGVSKATHLVALRIA